MSRLAKWKLEKTKVKVVFRLQFHATHIPQSGWDKLVISFIPTDSGKATAKTTKANVRNGTCKWGDPIYETTRLLQDAQSKQYDDKIYKFVVAMGSSRSSILGEASINLADYADAQKPSEIALPLHGCNSGTILHVTVQLLTSKTGFREFEQQRELRERGLQTGTDHIDKVHTRVRFRPESKELPSLEEEVGLNEEYADSAVGLDGSSNTSGSLSAEKHDTSSTHEVDSLKSTVSGDLNGSSHGQSPRTEKGDPSDHRTAAQGSGDWIPGWGSDYSVDNDLAIAYEENNRLRGSLEVAESSILELKLEMSTLQSHADEIGVETQKIAQQLAVEIASGEELAKHVIALKSECTKCKDDLERLKNVKLSPQVATTGLSNCNQNNLSGDIQLRWLNGLLVMEDTIRELQKKVYIGFHERDFRFLHSDLEALLGVLHDLKAKTNGTEMRKTSLHESEQFVSKTGFDVDLCQPEDMLHCLSIPGPTSQQPNSVDATEVLKSNILELLRELDESKTEKESLARKMDQMECYYEALVHELEENQKQMLGEFQNLRNEHSTCLCTIATNEAEIGALQDDINKQILRFSEERRDLDTINKELERRAITSEAALKRARLNYSIAVGQLQKDLDLLSFQVLSVFETNESLIKQTFSEASQPGFEGYIDVIKQNQEEPRVRKQTLGGDILLEDLKKSLHFQEELYQKVEEELSEMHLVNLQLDVFSKTLQETLLEASAGIVLMKAKIDELSQQLEFSNESQRLLILRLQTAMDDVCTLEEDKADCIAKCGAIVLQNQMLDANLGRISNDNCLLTQKIKEWEELLMKYRIYERKYEACSAEKTELVGLLKKETVEKGNLQNETSRLNEELKATKAENDQLASLKKYLEDEMGVSRVSLSTARSEILTVKQKFEHDIQDMVTKLDMFNALVEKLQFDLEAIGGKLEVSSKCEEKYEEQNEELFSGLAHLEVKLQQLTSENKDHAQEILGLDSIADELGMCKLTVVELMQEKQELMTSLVAKTDEFVKLASERDSLKENLKFLHDEIDAARVSSSTAESETLVAKQKFKDDIQEMVTKLDMSNALVQKLQFDLEAIANKLQVGSETEEIYEEQNKELLSGLARLEVELQQLISKNMDFAQEILSVGTITDELGRCKLTISELIQEKQDLMISLEAKTEESVKLTSERDSLKESLRFLHDEIDIACASSSAAELETLMVNQKFEHDIQDIMTKLATSNALVEKLQLELETLANKLQVSSKAEEKYEKQNEELFSGLACCEVELQQLTSKNMDLAEDILGLNTITDELGRCKLTVVELMQEKQDLITSLEAKTDESVKMALELDCLKENLRFLHDELHVERSFRHKLEGTVTDLNSQLDEKHGQLLRSSQQDAELTQFRRLASDLESEKSGEREEHLEKLREESFCLTDLEIQLSEMLQSYLATDIEVTFIRTQYKTRIEELSQQLLSSERLYGELHKKYIGVEAMLDRCLDSESHYIQENANLIATIESTKSELEASVAQNTILSDSNNAMMVQLEEYKKRIANLTNSEEDIDKLMTSKEELEIREIVLKAKFDEQLAQITFLEQCNDELVTLQNQCNDLSRRLSEQTLKAEEFKNLSIHLKELKDKAEAECLEAREKREPIGPSVAMHESLRIVFIKEQYETKLQELKQQLSMTKRHGEEMLLKLQDSIDEIQNRKKSEASHMKRNEELSLKILELEAELQSLLSDKREQLRDLDRIKAELDCALLSLECCKEEKQKLEASLLKCEEEKSSIAVKLNSTKGLLKRSTSLLVTGEDVEDTRSILSSEGEHLNSRNQDVPVPKGVNGIPKHAFLDQESLLQSDSNHLAFNDHFRTQSLKSSMDHLHEELERMKNENSLLPQNDNHFDPDIRGLEREIMQLNKANEELGGIFPFFNELPGSGNALERVLALEIELSEALRAKKKSSFQFQSSFLKQHSDEEALFQSFRDINELIKDMLELKGRYATVDTELKEMHDRYSQLSLQFAEVEGERQKLMMTLKNVRASKKLLHLNRSSSATIADHPS